MPCRFVIQNFVGSSYLMQGLRRHLLEELDQTFPDEVETYREIRAASAAVGYDIWITCLSLSNTLLPVTFFNSMLHPCLNYILVGRFHL